MNDSVGIWEDSHVVHGLNIRYREQSKRLNGRIDSKRVQPA